MLLIEVEARCDIPKGSDLRETKQTGTRRIPLYAGELPPGPLPKGFYKEVAVTESVWLVGMPLTTANQPIITRGNTIPAGSRIYIDNESLTIQKIVEPEDA